MLRPEPTQGRWPGHSARVLVAHLQNVKVYKYCDFGNYFPVKLKVLKRWQGGILHKMESTYLLRAEREGLGSMQTPSPSRKVLHSRPCGMEVPVNNRGLFPVEFKRLFTFHF